VHRLLDRRAVVRSAERDDVADAPHPAVAAQARLVTGAARHQPAHRVPDQRDPLDLRRPGAQQVGERAPVVRHVAAGVVTHVHRRAAELPREAIAVRRAAAESPRELGLEQAVQEHHHVAAGAGLDGTAAHAHGHRLLQVAALALERVADQAVDRRERGRAARCGGERSPVAHPAVRERRVGERARQPRARAHRAVRETGDRVVRLPHARGGGGERAIGDRTVHAGDPAGHRCQLAERKAAQGSQLVGHRCYTDYQSRYPAAPWRSGA
jgi:hypothetical protein